MNRCREFGNFHFFFAFKILNCEENTQSIFSLRAFFFFSRSRQWMKNRWGVARNNVEPKDNRESSRFSSSLLGPIRMHFYHVIPLQMFAALVFLFFSVCLFPSSLRSPCFSSGCVDFIVAELLHRLQWKKITKPQWRKKEWNERSRKRREIKSNQNRKKIERRTRRGGWDDDEMKTTTRVGYSKQEEIDRGRELFSL